MSDSLRPRGLHSPWNSPSNNTGVGSLSLLQGIFPTQGSNPDLPHCRRILYQLGHQGSPRILEWVVYPFSSGSSWPRNWTRVSCVAGGFFTNWAGTLSSCQIPGWDAMDEDFQLETWLVLGEAQCPMNGWLVWFPQLTGHLGPSATETFWLHWWALKINIRIFHIGHDKGKALLQNTEHLALCLREMKSMCSHICRLRSQSPIFLCQ